MGLGVTLGVGGWGLQVALCPSCDAAAESSGFGCVDLWRDDRPAHGENGTYNGYGFSSEAIKIIESHDPTSPLFIYAAWQEVHGPYEVPSKFRELFPADPFCPETNDNPTCCGVTDSFAANASDARCLWKGSDGVCKCNGGFTGFQPKGLTCPPGGQCSREYVDNLCFVSNARRVGRPSGGHGTATTPRDGRPPLPERLGGLRSALLVVLTSVFLTSTLLQVRHRVPVLRRQQQQRRLGATRL